ncbi:MAG: hypothetical protein JWO63_3190 [Frankiales bacterium]|nr:hypothetical protein [Frankiales bacterium]
MSLLEPLWRADADRVAVTVGDQSLTRAQLAAAAERVARQVQGAGVVAIDAEASLSTIVAVAGCLLAGVTAVPVPPDSGPRERAHLLTDSRAVLWLGRAGSPLPADVQIEAVPIGAVPIDAGPVDAVRIYANGGAGSAGGTFVEPDTGLALLMYTSGTTGRPKGVPISRAMIAASLDGLAEAWSWTPDDVLVHGLPLFHVHGLILGVLGALRVGSPLIHTGRPTPSAYAAAGGSLYFGVPTVWGRVAADPASARALASARLLVSGSAGLPAPVFASLAELTGQGPVERYGMTETLITVSGRAAEPRRAGWVGRPIAGVQTRLLDDEGRPVAADGESIGNLEVRGDTVFGGYLRSPEPPQATATATATATEFTPDGWFQTGDAAVIDASGQHRIVGRARDDLIKSGGYRIGAGEIEAVLLGHPSVSEVAVVGLPDADLGQRIVAFVVGTGVQPAALIELVATELSAHKRPREVRVVSELPRNAMGKVQKALLK